MPATAAIIDGGNSKIHDVVWFCSPLETSACGGIAVVRCQAEARRYEPKVSAVTITARLTCPLQNIRCECGRKVCRGLWRSLALARRGMFRSCRFLSDS